MTTRKSIKAKTNLRELVKPSLSTKGGRISQAQSLCIEFSPHNCDAMNKSIGDGEDLLF
jgi:hypothetical protein